MIVEYREVKPTHKPLPMIDEAERMRYFAQSAATTNGKVPSYRDVR